jgi:hypothetical protein
MTQQYEYRVVPAPRKGEKARGVKTVEDRFALSLTQVLNAQAREGWDYLRTDTLPCDERTGFTGRQHTVFQTVLVFRRALPQVQPAQAGAGAGAAPAAPQPAGPPPVPPVAGPAHDPLAPDPLDQAARRHGVAPPVARPAFGAAPRLVPVAEPPAARPAAPGSGLGPAATPAATPAAPTAPGPSRDAD